MEIENHPTEPSIRTVLCFSESEVIKALREHAERKGCEFGKGIKLSIWFPDGDSHCDGKTKLVADIHGAEPAITRKGKRKQTPVIDDGSL